MKRDALIIPFDENIDMVIASDNSGAIGMKSADDVSVPYDTVGYFSFRVAYMECAAAGGTPFSVILQNFNGDAAWEQILTGIRRGQDELGIAELPVTGSTESNFSFMQSAVGLTILGKRPQKMDRVFSSGEQTLWAAIIGIPLVAEEVIQQKEMIAPLKLFQWCCGQNAVLAVIPVGSKGILHELKQVFPNPSLQFSSDLDMAKTSGPSTCFIVVYVQSERETIETKTGQWFHGIDVTGGRLSL